MSKMTLIQTAKEIVASDDGQASYEQIAAMALRRHALPVTASAVAELSSALKADDEANNKTAELLRAVSKPEPLTRFEILAQEWEAAYAAAPRKEVQVQDEDGGSSIAVRVDRDWRYKGFENWGQFMAADPQWVEEQKLACAAAMEKGKIFLAQTALLSVQDRRKAFYALPDAVRGGVAGLLTRSQRKELL
jgi:hypothetical protein